MITNPSIFFSYQKLMSYLQKIKIVCGERGNGKSYGAKKICLMRGRKTKKLCFVWVRREVTEVEELKSQFLDDIKHDPEFENDLFEVRGWKIYYLEPTGEPDEYKRYLIGKFIALSTSQNLKSSIYHNVSLIIYDEYISLKTYLKNELTLWKDLLESVLRMRENWQIFMISNAMTTQSPYYDFYGIKFDGTKEFTTSEFAVLQYCDSKAYREAKKNTTLGKLFAKDEYGKHSIENEFLLDDTSNIKVYKGYKQYGTTLILEGIKMGVWICGNGIIYIDGQVQPGNAYSIYSEDVKNNEDCYLMTKQSRTFQFLKKKFYDNTIYYNNLKIKNACTLMFRKYLQNY